MSDSVAKEGIEDVLSSVKRLVSEEGRNLSERVARPSDRKPGRLILTDALRVNSPLPDIYPKQGSASEQAKPMLLRSCDIVKHPENPQTVKLKQEGDVAEASFFGQPGVADSKPDLSEADKNPPEDSLSAKIEALEAAIARTEDQWEPDGESDDAYSGTPTERMEWRGGVFTRIGAKDLVADAANDPGSVTPATKSDENTETESGVAVTAELAERLEDRAIGETAKFIHEAAAHSDAFDLVSTPIEAETEDARSFNEPELRQMITEIVREELRGALGERITRNVRKMVRREIHQALAAKNLQ